MKAFFDHMERNTDSIATFFFKPESPLRYEPGQFAELHVPHGNADQRGEHRIFTLTSLPDESLLSMVVRFPDVSSSYKQALLALTSGTELLVDSPLGDFVLPLSTTIPLVWAGGGVGSAAFVGMAKALAREAQPRDVTFFQSARSTDELLFGDIWRQASLITHQTVTGRDDSWPGRRSRFTANDLFEAAANRTNETMFYLAGPELMVEELASGLKAQGIRTDYIVREAFTGY